MPELNIKSTITQSSLALRSVLTNLDGLTQDSFTLTVGSSFETPPITKVFYIKTNIPITLVLQQSSSTPGNPPLVSFPIVVDSSCLLTDDYITISIQNPNTNTLPAEIFIVRGQSQNV